MRISSLAAVCAAFVATAALAQTAAPTAPAAPAPLLYGAPISLDQAKKAMLAAEAEARKNNWNVAIVVVDSGGNMVAMHRLDGTQLASIEIAKGKAVTANNYRRPSKALEDAVAGGGAGLRTLAIPGVMPLEGGVLVVADGKIIGAVGVSGVMSSQDAQVARAGADAVTR
ncbi:MAG: heme-binding protein [Polaromonas sp.]